MAHDILIVDDEADIRMLTAGILEDEGYQTREAANSTDALGSIEMRRPSLVLLDIWLLGSDLDGLGILETVKKSHPSIPVVMMSGHGNIETAVSAIRLGAYDFIEKPFKADRMLLVVSLAIEAARLRRENEELRLRAGTETELLGRSQPLSQVRQAIERVAGANSRVLITGPAGSGKEVAARMLHAHSRRAEAPFVVVNCATMSPERVEIELFGTEDGGEGPRKVGTFEAAHNGTLFLDEVADMPLETQGKIVRVLQEQTFERVGGSMRVEVDVRVVAATTRDLAREISEGRFREDLFYRLNVVPIPIPSLRERRDDIPVLAAYFMARAAEATGQQPRPLGEDAMAILQAYDWPGNVRELRNAIERLLIMAPGGPGETIRTDALPGELSGATPADLRGERGAEMMTLPLREAREVFEREYLLAQKQRFDGNISRTAAFVGMERSALHRKLKSLGIDND
jgi:two-component system, NtrC family, nitrogen regulation response regulator NtrX